MVIVMMTAERGKDLGLVVVELETHAVVDLVVLEGDVILVDVVPLLDPDLLSSGPGLSGHELLQVADRVVIVALDPHLLPQPVVQNNLYHLLLQSQLSRRGRSSSSSLAPTGWKEMVVSERERNLAGPEGRGLFFEGILVFS